MKLSRRVYEHALASTRPCSTLFSQYKAHQIKLIASKRGDWNAMSLSGSTLTGAGRHGQNEAKAKMHK
jgi:hypothetical protein